MIILKDDIHNSKIELKAWIEHMESIIKTFEGIEKKLEDGMDENYWDYCIYFDKVEFFLNAMRKYYNLDSCHISEGVSNDKR